MATGKICKTPIQNIIGARVSLDTYISSNDMYVCPSDGYLSCDVGALSTAKASARIFTSDTSDNNHYVAIGGWSNGGYPTFTCFVRKGMRIQVVVIENNGHVYFTPIS